jgi:HAE1 family hydrophobic/amphiphilic exporter-1/multidrug efflux pump
MSLSTISIKRPVLTIVLNLTIILFGVIGYTFLGVREFPSIDPAQISIRTDYAGANSDIIESQITEPIEKAINSIDGIKNITSSSVQGTSNITVEFNLDKDLETAANDVRDKVAIAAKSLPKDLDAPPVVSKADANADAIISMTIQSDTRSPLELSDFAENVVGPRLETIPGVSGIQIWGQKKYAMRLWIDPIKLAAYGCTVSDVKDALNQQNVELPSGKLTGNNTELTVKTVGNLDKPEQFNNIIIKTDGEKTVRFSDIGSANLGPENLETQMSQSGLPLVGVAIVPLPGANYLDISKEFYKKFETLKKDLPKDINLNIAIDNTVFVKKSVLEVAETLGISILLVILIIYLFFRDWAIAFRPLIDIPVSLIATFFIMWLFGFSINVLTLLAIVLATGLVVDDGIVVTENIFKKVEEGMSPIEAAIKGSNEIFFAVISISITLAAVFLPVIFLDGFVGRLFREFGVVIGAAVLISAFVSLTLTPMLNAYLMKSGEQKKSKFYNLTEPYFVKMNTSYASNLKSFMKRKWLSFPILFVCFGLIYLFFNILQKETAPYDDRSGMMMSITTAEGSSYEYTNRFMQEISQLLDDSIPEKKVALIITAPGFNASATNSGRVRIALVQPEYIIQAPNFQKLQEKIPLFMEEAAKDPTFAMTDVNLKFNKPEINVTIDREKAESMGISVLDIAQTLQLSFSGQRFGYFIMNGKQYQVIGQFDQKDRSKPLDLTSIFVRNNKGELIQMDNVVSISEKSNPPQLYHNNRNMSATVSAGLAPGKSISDGIEAMNSIKAKVLDDNFTTDLGGESRDFVESGSNTSFAFGLAVLLIFLILSAQFESFIDPFIIILTVPMAVAGALFSLWLFGQTWNIFSQIGTVMLIGLVTKNGILIVEFANQLREQGKPKLEAILEASEARLRPILMTSLAISLGALPIALSIGAASTSRIGMGVVIVGGTIFSLVLTLFVIPALYLMWSKARKHYPEFDHLEDYEKETK